MRESLASMTRNVRARRCEGLLHYTFHYRRYHMLVGTALAAIQQHRESRLIGSSESGES